MSKSKEEWRDNTLSPLLQRVPNRKETFDNSSSIEIDEIYCPEDVDSSQEQYEKELGYPGEYPYTRGIQPNMYRGRTWTMRQYSGYSTASETNARFRYLLDNGQTGLSVAFDLPTQIGYDSDHSLSQGEVGKVGVPICSVEDMDILFKDIPLDKVSTSMTINSTAAILLCMYIASAKRQGINPKLISGTIQNDILKEYIARGTYAFPPRPSMRLVVDIFKYCSEHLPNWNSISISGYHMREAGATATQELAFTFANAIAYVQAAVDAGLDIDEFAPRISFFFVAQNNLFEEVSKYRAARRIWSKIMKEQFGAENPRSMMLRFHTQTAGVTLTAQQPDNNLVRSTLQALAAVLGGTQSLHVNSRDEALGLPTPESAQLSLRTQQIIAHETGIADVVDPLGGSYFIETMTNQIESGSNDYLITISELGGAISAIEQGFQIREISESAYKHSRSVDSGKDVIVGVNEFITDQEPIRDILKINSSAASDQIERLSNLKKTRDAAKVTSSLSTLAQTASGDGNLVPPILNCVENYCTLGEISQVLRDIFGEQSGLSDF